MTDQQAKYPPTASEAQGQLHDIADKATERLKGAAASALQSAERMAEQAREYGEKAQKVVNEFKPMVEKSLKEQPMVTLASFAAIGFVLGVLWKK
jgi:ElaB/YqjD/DUF883 family membrane-anchored ribosome-binding protein